MAATRAGEPGSPQVQSGMRCSVLRAHVDTLKAPSLQSPCLPTDRVAHHV